MSKPDEKGQLVNLIYGIAQKWVMTSYDMPGDRLDALAQEVADEIMRCFEIRRKLEHDIF